MLTRKVYGPFVSKNRFLMFIFIPNALKNIAYTSVPVFFAKTVIYK